MPELLFVFFVLSVLFIDAVIVLFKKLSLGNLGASLKDADHETGPAICICILCCPAFSVSLTTLIWKSKCVFEIIFPAIFFFVAYAFYRPMMLYSDKAARKHESHFSENRIKRAQRGRRWFSLAVALLAFLASYFLSPLIYKFLIPVCQ